MNYKFYFDTLLKELNFTGTWSYRIIWDNMSELVGFNTQYKESLISVYEDM